MEDADIVVRLVPSSDKKSGPFLSLPLHSHVLCDRSEYFAALLSKRWHSPDADASPHANDDLNDSFEDVGDAFRLLTIDVSVPDTAAVSVYKRCIELMYVPRPAMSRLRRPFSGVDEALHMLHVAAEFLFHDCTDACMQFLEMLPPWTASEEESIRATLSHLQLRVHVDLAARLGFPEGMPLGQPMHAMRAMVAHVLHESCKDLKERGRNSLEGAIDPSKPIPEAIDPSQPITEASILALWYSHTAVLKNHIIIGSYKYSDSNMQWLFTQLVALQAADAFAQDIELSSLTEKAFNNCYNSDVHSPHHVVIQVLCCITQAVLDGGVCLPRRSRLTLVTTWFPVFKTFNARASTQYATLIHMFQKLIKNLPLVDMEHVFKLCIVPNYKDVLDISPSFSSWCATLRQEHIRQEEGRQVVRTQHDESPLLLVQRANQV